MWSESLLIFNMAESMFKAKLKEQIEKIEKESERQHGKD
jgi:hypothetical protein